MSRVDGLDLKRLLEPAIAQINANTQKLEDINQLLELILKRISDKKK
jgi:hypothetical protein